VARTRLGALRRVALGLVLLLVAAVAVEGVSSLWSLARDVRALQPPPENFRQAKYDTLVGWVPMPNLAIRDNFGPGIPLTTSADGMRIHRPVATLAAGERRIICSGDSFTFGSGVGDSDTFCARLEHELPGTRTLNMAQRGYGNDQMYLRYRRDAARYPHQLHLFAFIWGDFERMSAKTFLGYSKPLLRLRDDRLVVENVPVPPWKGWSRWTAAAGVLPQSRLMQLVSERAGDGEGAKLRRVDARVLDVSAWIFRDLAKLGRERGSALVLVYLPTIADLRPGAHDERRRWLATFGHDSGVPVVDLTDEMRQLPTDSLQWLFITANQLPVNGSGGHYTAAGHAWVASRLAAHLKAIPAADSALTAPSPSPIAAKGAAHD
jgi:hypothetical protein